MKSNKAGAFVPLVAGAATALIFLAFYALHGFYPFGERSVVWCDMDQQYVPMLMELKTAYGDGSLFLGRGGGLMNFYGVFLFFVSSPLSLITLAVDNNQMIFAVNLLLVMKTALCSVSIEYYFRKVIPRLNAVFGIIMSVMYSVSGYVMMFYQNDMWLDMMMVFPLLLVALFRLIEKGRWGAFTLCTVLCVFLSFYISFMIIVFLVMMEGAAVYLCCPPENREDRSVKLIISNMCSALLSGLFWLPAFMQYTSSGRGNSLASLYFGGNFFENTFDKTALLSGSSLAVAGAVLVLLFYRRISSGKAVLFAAGGVMSLIGAFIEPINKLLHIGSYQAYPFRYAFIVLLLIFSACGELLIERDTEEHKKSAYVIASVLAAVFAVAAIIAYNFRSSLSSYANYLSVNDEAGLILTALCILGAVAYLFCLLGYCKGWTKRGFTAAIMAFIMICESFVCFGVNIDEITDSVAGFKHTAEAFSVIPDEGFVRVKAGRNYYYPNYAEGFGKYSLGHYTSLTDCDFLYAMKRLGYSSYWLDTTSAGSVMLIDELLMNKYVIGRPHGRNKAYEVFDSKSALTVYTDTHVLKGGLISDIPPSELEDFEEHERIGAADYIAERLFGIEDLSEKLSPDRLDNVEISENGGKTCVKRLTDKKCCIGYNLYVNGRKELYFDIFGNYSTELSEDYYESAEILVNGTMYQERYPSSFCSGIIDLGTFENEKVNVMVRVKKDFEATSFGLWMYDLEKSEKAADSAHTAPIKINGRVLTASADRGGYLYIPAAWSENWSCTVNGETTPLIRTLGALSAVELPKGGGEVKLSFLPKGIKMGTALSISGAVIFMLMFLLMNRDRKKEKLGKISMYVVYLLSIATVFLCYIAAPILWSAVNIISLIVGG
ncbi:MAG: YfhO family protein [Ruminococcus sp.]|nr:YfhO family protein [Ruminococcus sp.]